MDDIRGLAERLTRIERKLRQTRILAAGIAATLLVIVTAAAVQGKPAQGPADLTVKVLTADRIVVTGNGTKTWEPIIEAKSALASLTFNAIGLSLSGDDQYSVQVSANRVHSAIRIYGPAKPGATLDVGGHKEPIKSQTRVDIGCSADGSYLRIQDSMDRERVSLGVQGIATGGQNRDYPESTLTLWDETGKCLHHAGTK